MRVDRFSGLEAADWLRAMGLADDTEGWSAYLERLRQLALDPAKQDALGFAAMSRGWAIGSDSWRKAVASDHAHLAIQPGLAAAEARALREQSWTACLARLLVQAKRYKAKRTDADAQRDAKSAPWKIALAARLRAESGASIIWIAASLHMGNPNAVRGYLSRHRFVCNSGRQPSNDTD